MSIIWSEEIYRIQKVEKSDQHSVGDAIDLYIPEDIGECYKDIQAYLNGEVEYQENIHRMKQDRIDMIYNPFFTTKEVGKGMGIGMSLVNNFIKDMNGKIEIDSVEAKGTISVLACIDKPESLAKARTSGLC